MKVARSEARTRATIEFLAEVVAVPVEQPREKQDPAVTEEGRRLFVRAVDKPEAGVTEHYKAAGLTAAKGKKGLDELMAKGYVKLHYLSRRGRGGRLCLLEVLESANPLIVKLGLQRPAPKLKGGWLHDVIGRYLEQWARARGLRHWFEKTLD